MIQTTVSPTAETSVLNTLLTSLAHLDEAPETFLLQGISRRTGQSTVESSLRDIPGVSLLEVNVGLLGIAGLGLPQKRAKAASLVGLGLSLPSVLAASRRFQPDLVYSAQQKWDLRLATLIANVMRCPQAVHLHYRVGPWLGRGSVRIMQRARLVICVSDFIRRQASSAIRGNVLRTLHNSVHVPEIEQASRAETSRDFRRELRVPEQSTLVGMVARLSPEKRQEVLLEAMIPILRRQPTVHLVLAGQEYPPGNGLSDLLQHAAAREGVMSQVHLLGPRRDVARILLSLDVFAHPSLADPCPLAVLEAMASGLPVAAVRDGGLTELVVHRDTGMLAEPDDRSGLTGAVELLLSDNELRTTMGGRARARAAGTFHPEAAARRFLTLLAEAART